MNSASKLLWAMMVLLFFASVAWAQTAANKATGTITGRITVGAQPASGVDVLLKTGGNLSPTDFLQSGPATTATTDAEGWYRLTGVAAGNYRIVAYAPAYVVEGDTNPLMPGKPVNVGEGETVENINFSITRGGVVTGMVTDPDGRTVIAESVKAYKLDANGNRQKSNAMALDFAGWQTDDRGVYRIYGLDPGRYIIAAGPSSEDAMVRMGGASSGAYYQRTFYPDVADEAKAKIIEVKSGDEAENVDVRLARTGRNKSFAATGRITEAESGKPVPGMMVGYSITKEGSASFGFGNSASNSQGEFRLEGLTPNSYQAFVVGLEQSENYGEPVNFEIAEGDVSGLEIKMHLGASISGVAVVEGATDPQAISKLREKLAKVQIYVRPVESGGRVILSNIAGGMGQIGADSTFKLGGVRPGRIQLMANTDMADKGLSLLRVEQNGAEVKELQLNAGDRVTGLRMVFSYGTASVAGRVDVRGGALPPNARLFVLAVRDAASDSGFNSSFADVDSRGQFLIEGLSQGSYKLKLESYDSGGQEVKLPKVEQQINVVGSGRQEVTLVLDLSRKEGQ